ncbi:hypothetical protein [Hoyosella subflava]|uniref:hypothetical protein n=1 Tax=Hoyosella subflava TaxID=639313 RepID=UPI000674BF59|nr:hypothetical protein [Hoyosella subflava]
MVAAAPGRHPFGAGALATAEYFRGKAEFAQKVAGAGDSFCGALDFRSDGGVVDARVAAGGVICGISHDGCDAQECFEANPSCEVAAGPAVVARVDTLDVR